MYNHIWKIQVSLLIKGLHVSLSIGYAINFSHKRHLSDILIFGQILSLAGLLDYLRYMGDFVTSGLILYQERMRGESESPIHGPLSMKIISNLFSVSYCVLILRTTPHWSERMTSCNLRLLIWEQKTKITFATRVLTKNKFEIMIMGHGDSLSYFILLFCTIHFTVTLAGLNNFNRYNRDFVVKGLIISGLHRSLQFQIIIPCEARLINLSRETAWGSRADC